MVSCRKYGQLAMLDRVLTAHRVQLRDAATEFAPVGPVVHQTRSTRHAAGEKLHDAADARRWSDDAGQMLDRRPRPLLRPNRRTSHYSGRDWGQCSLERGNCAAEPAWLRGFRLADRREDLSGR